MAGRARSARVHLRVVMTLARDEARFIGRLLAEGEHLADAWRVHRNGLLEEDVLARGEGGKGDGMVNTVGQGTFEPQTDINIYEYSKPKGVVVVRTREVKEESVTEDTVLATTIPLFKVGEKITYTLRP